MSYTFDKAQQAFIYAKDLADRARKGHANDPTVEATAITAMAMAAQAMAQAEANIDQRVHHD